MRQYQKDIYNALVKKCNWIGEKTSVTTNGGVTTIVYYCTTIAVINHTNKTAEIDNGGYNTVSTTSRINAVKEFCKDHNYSIKEA